VHFIHLVARAELLEEQLNRNSKFAPGAPNAMPPVVLLGSDAWIDSEKKK
jgi:hypothetical protein